MADPAQKRVVTSAIQGMSVKEVRSCLNGVRTQWMNANTEPFFITNSLLKNPVSLQIFSLMFVRGQHHKRHSTKPLATLERRTKKVKTNSKTCGAADANKF